jgi:hypothetical protein
MTVCVAPGCSAVAETVFTVAHDPPPELLRPWRFAGRDWQPGDEIRLCPPHAHDVYMAQGVYDPSQVAGWLRPDAADPPNTWRGRRPW